MANGLTLHPDKTHHGDSRVDGQRFEFLGNACCLAIDRHKKNWPVGCCAKTGFYAVLLWHGANTHL